MHNPRPQTVDFWPLLWSCLCCIRHAGAFVGPNGIRKEDDPKNWAAFKTGMRTDVTMGRTVARDPSDDANVYILGDEPEFPIQTLPSNDAAVMGCLASLGCESGACSNRAEAAAKGWDSRIFCLPGSFCMFCS